MFCNTVEKLQKLKNIRVCFYHIFINTNLRNKHRMSLPPALLKRLAQRGLVEKQKASKAKEAKDNATTKTTGTIENEEVIAEDYDELEELEHPSLYESTDTVKRPEENFWLERMKLRIGEAGSLAGHKGCPNKYNIYHKCTLFCVNRWGEGHVEPSRDYIKRYKRLLRRYPLPKGWTEMYDPGCGCFYFWNNSDSMVSWLPPTHPKSDMSRCAAAYRRQLEEASTGGGAGAGGSSEEEKHTDEEEMETMEAKHQKEIEEIIKFSMRSRSPPATEFQNTPESAVPPPRKQKSRDLEKTLLRQRREKEREREQDRGHARSRRHGRAGRESDVLDPMDPSAYSDIPRGKWSDGLNIGAGEERKKSNKDDKLKSKGEVLKAANQSGTDDEDD